MLGFSNPSKQFESYKDEIELAIQGVIRGNQYINGKEVEKIEKNFAKFIDSKFAIGVANGTDALEISLRALNIGPGDEVITTTHTAVATVSAIESVGAKPVLTDINKTSYTINNDQFDELLNNRTKAIIPVHIYGNAANVDHCINYCSNNNLHMIEDVSQAHGGKINDIRLGNIGNISCYSCYPTKNLGALGDAGLITTNDLKLEKKIRMIREYGWDKRYVSELCGRNSRLDEVQAAVLNVKLKYLDNDNKRRIEIAKTYSEELSGITELSLPEKKSNVLHVYHLYVIQTSLRDKLKEYLFEKKISTGIHYPIPIHLQPAYKDRIAKAKDMSVSELAAKEIMSLPIYPELEMKDVLYVCDTIKDFFKK